MEPMINNGDNRKEKRIISEPTPVDLSLGGSIAQNAKQSPNEYQNTCAARLSQALNENGIIIPNIPGQTIPGDGNKYYFIRAIDMSEYMKSLWGEARYFTRPTKILNGIVFQSGFNGVTGHVDIFYNGKSGGAAYLYYWNLDGKHQNIKTSIWKYGK